MSDVKLTDLQRRVLVELAKHGTAQTPNAIGIAIGVERVVGGRGQGGRGMGHRVFGRAQRIIPTLTSLRNRELIHDRERPDGMSGVAYVITDAGREAIA